MLGEKQTWLSVFNSQRSEEVKNNLTLDFLKKQKSLVKEFEQFLLLRFYFSEQFWAAESNSAEMARGWRRRQHVCITV